MSRRPSLIVLSIALLLLAPAGLRTLHADEPKPQPAGGSLLERLSDETAALAERGERASAHVVSERGVWIGILVGDAGHVAVALDPMTVLAQLPPTAKLRQAGQPEVEVTLLDADSDLGLAIYTTGRSGTGPRGLKPAVAQELVRGRLALLADAPEPELTTLGARAGPWEDVPARESSLGVALLAPGGSLLGLAPLSSQTGSASCTACHTTVGAGNSGVWLSRWLASPGEYRAMALPDPGIPHATAPLLARATDASSRVSAVWLNHVRSTLPGTLGTPGSPGVAGARAFVPGPVIARALEDVADGRRLGRAYLGVVPEGGSVVDAWGNPLVHFTDYVGKRRAFSLTTGVDWTQGQRLRLAQVLSDSPAARAGLKAGQEVVSLDDVEVRGASHFARMLARRRPGETVRLAIQGQAEPVSIVLGDRDKEGRALATAASVGLEVQALTAELSAFLNVETGEGGVVVRAVTADSAAAQAGLQRGDVIRDGGGGPIRDVAELDAVLGTAREAVVLGVEREGQRTAVTLQPPKAGAGRQPR